MPGTIHVSVLDILDLPSEANTSPLSLKVAMGKREYQTSGKGDFSFPVVSLRNNLTVTLYDMNGNMVSRREFKTMSVMEKGTLDDLFPLEGGGHVHIKLQFSLSKQEETRIREMRDSALKLKHRMLELPNIGLENSFSESRESFDQSARANKPNEPENPLGTQSPQNVEANEALSANSFEREIPRLTKQNQETIKTQPPSEDIQERDISSRKHLDTYIRPSVAINFVRDSEDLSSVAVEEGDQIPSIKSKNLLQKSSSNNVKKMISAFENNTSQGMGSQYISRVNHGGTEGLTKNASSKENPIIKENSLQTMVKSSAGMLSDTSFQQNMKFPKPILIDKQGSEFHFDHGKRGNNSRFLDFKTSENFKNMEPEKQKDVKVKDEGSSMDYLYTAQLTTSVSTSTVLRPVGLEEAVSSDLSEHVSEEPALSMHTDSINAVEKNIELDIMPEVSRDLDADTAQGNSDVLLTSHNSEKPEAMGIEDNQIGETKQNEDKMDDDIGVERISSDYLQLSFKRNSEHDHKDENKDNYTILKEDELPGKNIEAFVNEHETSTSVPDETRKVTDYRSSRSFSNEQIATGTSTKTADLCMYSDYERCPFGSFGIWIPKRLCITSGSKQLWNLADCL